MEGNDSRSIKIRHSRSIILITYHTDCYKANKREEHRGERLTPLSRPIVGSDDSCDLVSWFFS